MPLTPTKKPRHVAHLEAAAFDEVHLVVDVQVREAGDLFGEANDVTHDLVKSRLEALPAFSGRLAL